MKLCCAVLCCAVLCCVVLCFTVLFWIRSTNRQFCFNGSSKEEIFGGEKVSFVRYLKNYDLIPEVSL